MRPTPVGRAGPLPARPLERLEPRLFLSGNADDGGGVAETGSGLGPAPYSAGSLAPLRVASDRTHLVDNSGRPFFWLADTAWELFHRLSRDEADLYLRTRAQQGFNVVQAVALAELGEFNSPNAHGDSPLDGSPLAPATTAGSDPADAQQYDYWDHVDFIVDRAESLGMYTALLPTWGSHVSSGTLTPEFASAYGLFLGQRYADEPIVWVLGGDRPSYGTPFWTALADGIATGVNLARTGVAAPDHSLVLMSYHPDDGNFASEFHPDAPWLDFDMFQSGHSSVDLRNDLLVELSRDLTDGSIPTLDAEPRYEDGPIAFSASRGYFNDFDVRQAAYWSVFSGALGHTYGHHSVWQMYAPGRAPVLSPLYVWYDALNRPGAQDMGHLRALMESRPLLGRVHAPDLVADAYGGADHIEATLGDGFALIYAPTGRTFSADLSRLGAAEVRASWFDPREGTYADAGTFAGTGYQTFAPPTSGRGNDWVLVLEAPDGAVPNPGDANRDGRVDAADYAATDRGFALGLGGWENGDFDGSGHVTADDYLILDIAFMQQALSATSPAAAATEPRPVGAPPPAAPLFATADSMIEDVDLFADEAEFLS